MGIISIIPITGLPIIKEGDDIVGMMESCLGSMGETVEDGDVFVIASTIISKQEGQLHDLRDIEPTGEAKELSLKTGKDPRLCELIIRSSEKILKVGEGPIISLTKQGFICASAGIDTSNIAGDKNIVATLPQNPDDSAVHIREELEARHDKRVAVIISDTQGRPFRAGAIGVCVGLSGIEPFVAYRGKKDLYGYELRASVIGRADEIASAADIAMGQSDEGFPVIIVRGANFIYSDDAKATGFIREREKDLFR